MERRRTYTKEFKESAVELYHHRGNSLKAVSEELGINPENLRRWIHEIKEGEKGKFKVFPGQGNPRDEEVYQLKKEVAELRESNEILKKAMAFFVVKTPR